MEGQYFSVTSISQGEIDLRIGASILDAGKDIDLHRTKGYLWALWDIWPSGDVYRPPYLSGIVKHKDEVLEIASQYTLDNEVNFVNDDEFNWLLTRQFKSLLPVVSYIKKGKDNYFLSIWGTPFHYLSNMSPSLLKENITEEQLKEIASIYIPEGYSLNPNSGYAKGYIKRRAAYKKSTATPISAGNATFIEFLYSPEEEWMVLECRWVWQRHRVVKKTERFIYVEKAPYKGGGTIKSGWQSYISATCRIDRKILEEQQSFWHKPTCKTFTTLSYNKKLKNTKFVDEFESSDDFDDYVIELPESEIAWAVKMLDISWPETKQVIKKTFASRAIIHHPDKGGSGQRFAEYKRARDLLIDNL